MLEVIDMVNDWLNGEHGVNFHLQALQVQPGDDIPTPIAHSLCHHRNDALAVERMPTVSGPILIVQQNGVWRVDPQAAALQSIVPGMPIAIWYVTSNNNSARAERDCYYTITALRRCMYEFINKAPSSNRIRNSIQIMTVTDTSVQVAKTDIGNAMIRACIVFTFRVRDLMAGDSALVH